MLVGELFPTEMFYDEGLVTQESFDSPHTFLGLVGQLLNQHPWEHSFSGGGQGNGKKPPTKIRGTQDRARREKHIVPQKPVPTTVPTPKKGK